MLFAAGFIAAVALIIILRKRMRFLSLILIAEVFVLSLMLVAMGISAAGIGSVELRIFTEAVTTQVALFGMKISTFMLLQAVTVILIVLCAIYALTFIVKKALKTGREKNIFKHNPPIKIFIPRKSEARKVFKLYCRMNC